MGRAEPLIDVAAAVADGSPVDWDGVERQSDARTRDIVRNLGLLERIASIHTSLPVAAFERSLRYALPPATADPPADRAPSTWGPLTIVERIGQGRYADVYLARDPRLDRPVALKLLRRRDGRDTVAIDEARLLARVRHPNVIAVYGAERVDGRAGIWMDFVDGRTLEQELRERGPLPANEIVAIGVSLSDALAAVHAAGLLHRDIKTQNVMRGKDGRIVLSDFGTSSEIAQPHPGGQLAGTPLYLAPEILRGEPASTLSDVYSLGVLLYHLATGTFPVCGRSLADLHDALTTNVRVGVRQRQPDLPAPLASVIERAIDPVPGRRHPSASALRTALHAAAIRGRRISWAVAATVALVAAGLFLPRWFQSAAPVAPRFVLVGAFENATGDRRLDDVVQFAFAQELMQSRAMTVVPTERIVDALRLMKRPASTRLDAATAREVGLRDGDIQLIATGRIDWLEAKYVVHVTVDETSTGRRVAQASVESVGIDRLLDGARTLAGRIRTTVGDDQGRVDVDGRLERVTTGTLDALREYTAGVALVDARQWAAAEQRLAAAARLDPSFASALIMLAHTRLNLRHPPAGYMPAAESALQLAAGLPARERYFIQGSYYLMTADLPAAAAVLEALTQEYPNDYWGLNNLAAAYDGLGRYREGIAVSRHMAGLRPNDFIALLENAAALVVAGDGLADARRIAARASQLDRPGGPVGEVYSAWLDLFPAFEAWADGRITDAAALLDAPDAAMPADDRHAYSRGQLNLALGRVHAAERAFQAMSSPSERAALVAYAALARGDTAAARTALVAAAPQLTEAPAVGVGSFGRASVICWSLLRAGFLDACRRLAQQPPLRADRVRWIEGELAAADQDYDRALSILQEMRRTPPGTPQKFVGLDTLATILEQRGDLDAAADVLRQSDGAQSTLYPQSGPGGFFWLLARAHLMNIERQLGHVDRADVIAGQLRHLLAVADPDFVLWQAIR